MALAAMARGGLADRIAVAAELIIDGGNAALRSQSGAVARLR